MSLNKRPTVGCHAAESLESRIQRSIDEVALNKCAESDIDWLITVGGGVVILSPMALNAVEWAFNISMLADNAPYAIMENRFRLKLKSQDNCKVGTRRVVNYSLKNNLLMGNIFHVYRAVYWPGKNTVSEKTRPADIFSSAAVKYSSS